MEEGRDTVHTQQGELLNLFLIAQEEGRPENNAAPLKILEENGSQSRVLYPVYIYINIDDIDIELYPSETRLGPRHI